MTQRYLRIRRNLLLAAIIASLFSVGISIYTSVAYDRAIPWGFVLLSGWAALMCLALLLQPPKDSQM
jgi:hypothetical protein